jgi:RNA-binding protein
MSLTGKQKNQLRGLAHKLKPIVAIGSAGYSDAIKAELDLALGHHELLKLKIPALAKKERDDLVAIICEETKSEFVQAIGHILVLYRPATEPKISLVK